MGHSYGNLESMLRGVLPRMGVSLRRAYVRAADLSTPLGDVRLVRDKKGTTWRCKAVNSTSLRSQMCEASSARDALELLIEKIEVMAVEQLSKEIKGCQDA